jgi:hypothetical protein
MDDGKCTIVLQYIAVNTQINRAFIQGYAIILLEALRLFFMMLFMLN